MDIEITYPPGNTGVLVPSCFLAMGKKVDAAQPIGVMLSVNDQNQPDGKYRIGGETLTYKPDSNGMTQDSKVWAILFRMSPKISHRQRFTLVVFDAAKLPGEIVTQNPLVIRENLYVKRKAKRKGSESDQLVNFLTFVEQPKRRENVANNQISLLAANVVEPLSGGTAAASWFLVHGQLPQGCDGVDRSETEVVNADNLGDFKNPLWAEPDETGYWYALFPDLTGWERANLRVVYTPNGDDEEIINITLI